MYITQYDKTSFYEPAEGGYYYEGLEFIQSYRVKHGKAQKELDKLYRDLKRNAPKRYRVTRGSRCVCISTGNVGEGYELHIECRRKIGHLEKGAQTYC